MKKALTAGCGFLEQGWVEVEGQDSIIRDSFVSGEAGALSVRYFRTEDRSVRAKAVFGSRTQGPPGFAHGGSMAALLDE
jgi:acyl-coenzyme A thioesterase PaaI-like protein